MDKQSAPISFVLGWYHTLRRKYTAMVTNPESLCVVSFDEFFKKSIQQEQIDLILRFGDEE